MVGSGSRRLALGGALLLFANAAFGNDAPTSGATETVALEAAPAVEVAAPIVIRCAKALTVPPDASQPQVVDNALVFVREGKIERVVSARGTEIPDGYEEIDVGDNWCMPGLVELHCHEGGTYDINDLVYLANPGLSSRSAIIPDNDRLRVGIAAGVTTVLFIPGSGSNVGGAGILFKTGHDKYEDALVRDPGSLKLAQWGNPESWTIRVGMAFENWNTRNVMRRGKAYGERWKAFDEGRGPQPERDIQFDIYRQLVKNEAQISTHTQMYQVVLMTITMIRRDFGLPVFLDHSSVGGWLTGALAQELGVPAIVGPRSVDTTARGMVNWARNKHEGMRGLAAGYQEKGLEMVGFNTDSPVIPQEELQLQAGMGVRYGLDDSNLAAVRGLTIIPAMTVNLGHRLGTLSPGADADVVVITGHPGDPRSSVEKVFVDGKKMYDTEEEVRRW